MSDSHDSASARHARQRHLNRGLRKRCGCARSKWNKCAHPWHFNYKPDVGPNKGKHFRISLDKHLQRRIEGKTDAEREARNLRTAIDEGRFGVPVPTRDALTVEQLLRAYLRDYVTPERPRSVGNVEYQIAAIARTPVELLTGERRAFGAWLVVDVTTGALEKFPAARRTQALVTVRDQDGRDRSRLVGGVLTTNRNLALLRAAFNWAIRLGHLEATPFKRHTETVVKLSKETARRRRLEGDEGERLLKACDPVLLNPRTKQPWVDQPPARLRPIVEAAIESGCRRGELLSLQRWQVKGLGGVNPRLDLPAAKTKTKRDRVVPISTRLKAILEMRLKDPAGRDLPGAPTSSGMSSGSRPGRSRPPGLARVAARGSRTCSSATSDAKRGPGGSRAACRCTRCVTGWGTRTSRRRAPYLESTLQALQGDAMRRFEEARARQAKPATKGRVQRSPTEGGKRRGDRPPSAERPH